MSTDAAETWLSRAAKWAAQNVAWFALVAALWGAHEARVQAGAAVTQLDLERKPVLVLAGQPTFLLQERLHHVSPPAHMLFLEPGLVQGLQPFDATIPQMNAAGLLYELPPLYGRFSLMNGGRLPLVDIKIPVTVHFYLNPSDISHSQTERIILVIPLLMPGGTYEFGVANASTLSTSYQFDRFASLIRVDTERVESATLFIDRDAAVSTMQVLHGYARREWQKPHVPRPRPTAGR